jgi:hypothetical protein
MHFSVNMLVTTVCIVRATFLAVLSGLQLCYKACHVLQICNVWIQKAVPGTQVLHAFVQLSNRLPWVICFDSCVNACDCFAVITPQQEVDHQVAEWLFQQSLLCPSIRSGRYCKECGFGMVTVVCCSLTEISEPTYLDQIGMQILSCLVFSCLVLSFLVL